MPDEIRQYFEAEARELIDRLTAGVAALDPAALDPAAHDPAAPAEASAAAIAAMLRAAHTLKGAAHVVGERRMAAQAHAFEDELAGFRKQPSPERGARLLALVDDLAFALAGSDTEEVRAPFIAQPQRAMSGSGAASGPHVVPEPPAAPSPALPARTVRVEVAETARLLAHVGASGALVAAVRDHAARLEALADPHEAHRLERAELRLRLRDDLDRLQRQIDELERTASQLRVISTEALLLGAGRVVRSTAAALGRRVACVTRGGNERVEVRILDRIADAMLHLIRNAVAHGIEPPAERLAAGKAAEGTVTVAVERRGPSLRFSCADDGRGIALEAVRQAAVGRGRLAPEAAAAATREALLALLLEPGFSVGAGGSVDQVSGRGVGLDAVREAAQALDGEVRIESTPGRGTMFTLVVPQTVFATAALEVVAGGLRYALPLSAVEQTFRGDAHPTFQSQGTQTLLLGRETMPLVSLDELAPVPPQAYSSARTTPTSRANFKAHENESRADKSLGGELSESTYAAPLPYLQVPDPEARKTCIILQADGRRAALLVERIEGLSEVLVQPLPGWAGLEPWLAGAALGSRGVPQLVIDAAGLVARAGQPVAPRTRTAAPAPTLPVLVIDDSLTTRMLEQSILEAEGYQVDLATSAEQGLRMARARPYALFLVDVEMPGMNGFEFVAAARADEHLRGTPAILVTSLDSAESRERGRVAGAFSYIVKGEFNQPEYLDRIARAVAGRTRTQGAQ